MSRVGKNPVLIPAGVTVDLKGQHLKAKGKRGELQFTVHDDVEVTRDGDKLNFAPRGESTRPGEEVDPSRPSTIPVRLMDDGRARRDLGFVPRVPLEEGLRRTLAWYRQNGPRNRL